MIRQTFTLPNIPTSYIIAISYCVDLKKRIDTPGA